MIYCIGITVNYERYIDEQNPCMKKGKTDDYEGGSVWETQVDAQAYADYCCPPNVFSVYQVDADWEKDTEVVFGKCWHALLRNAEITRCDGF